MKYLDDRIINATIPNHTMVPNNVLEKLLVDKEKDTVLLKRAYLTLCSGGIVFILALIYFYRTHKKMKEENGEIKNYFETMVPLVSAKLNQQPDGKSTTTNGTGEQTKVIAELNTQPEPNSNSESRQP